VTHSYRHTPIYKDHDRWFKRAGRRRVRAREHLALATERYDLAPVRSREASHVYQWADWRYDCWGMRLTGRAWWREMGK
jgi:hypothetical protein